MNGNTTRKLLVKLPLSQTSKKSHGFLSFFFLLQNQRTGRQNRSCPEGRVGTTGRGEIVGDRSRRVNIVQKCVYMHVNAKMTPIETTP
jgi:hypothetical protein